MWSSPQLNGRRRGEGGLRSAKFTQLFAISQFSAIFPPTLLPCPPRVRVGAPCVPCAEVLLCRAARNLPSSQGTGCSEVAPAHVAPTHSHSTEFFFFGTKMLGTMPTLAPCCAIVRHVARQGVLSGIAGGVSRAEAQTGDTPVPWPLISPIYFAVQGRAGPPRATTTSNVRRHYPCVSPTVVTTEASDGMMRGRGGGCWGRILRNCTRRCMTFHETIGGSNGLGKLHSSASSGTHRPIFGVVMPLGGLTASWLWQGNPGIEAEEVCRWILAFFFGGGGDSRCGPQAGAMQPQCPLVVSLPAQGDRQCPPPPPNLCVCKTLRIQNGPRT